MRQANQEHQQETMKMRLLLTLVGLAIIFALPTFAQQKDTVDSQIAEQVTKKFDEAFNNGDAAALAALYTEDAVFVTPQGPVFGREAIEKHFAGVFQQGHFSNHLNKDDQGSPHMIGTAGNEVWRSGEWSFTLQGKSGGPIQLKGYWGAINVREGDTWRIRMQTFNVTPPPTAETK
jgi:ketosteroid isomerase-like protein